MSKVLAYLLSIVAGVLVALAIYTASLDWAGYNEWARHTCADYAIVDSSLTHERWVVTCADDEGRHYVYHITKGE